MSYRPRSFILQELVPPSIFDRMGEEAWTLLDPDALQSLQELRDRFGPIVVNDWHRGGSYRESGLREADTRTGAPKSAHKRGQAFDCKPKLVSVRHMYEFVLEHQTEFPLIRRLESIEFARTWMHFDVVPHPFNGIKVFNP